MNEPLIHLSQVHMEAKQLNERTRYSIIPSYSVVIHQNDQTVVLSNEEVSRIFVEMGTSNKLIDPPGEYDARNGCQA